MITGYHAKYYANLLTQQAIGGNIDTISQSLLNASVDINPHQIEAALFAFKSPLSKGVILADEVGLGKTIEAGLVLCQYWATGRRKIIIVCPASLRKQWSLELTEKFGIDNEILDTKNYNAYLRNGRNPFSNNKVLICSYNFAASKKTEIIAYGFQLAVIDEAHKLRNVYKKNSKTAHAVRDALDNVKKLLLTATPFQNSLMELYGLTTVIDANIFGDGKSFRNEYMHDENLQDLQMRLSPYYKRTLRKDVTEYVNFTRRLPLTQKFDATDLEQELYNGVSEFLRNDNLYSIPARQKMLTTMIIRKILASSTYALLGTLKTIKERLQKILESNELKPIEITDLVDSDEIDIIAEDTEDSGAETEEINEETTKKIDIVALKKEIMVIDGFITLAIKIKQDSKAIALLKALHSAFLKLPKLGANRKALIFTESTRTQKYLKEFLEANGYEGKLVLFNGNNTDRDSSAIYKQWCVKNEYNGKVSGIKTADRRAALVDYFKETAEIMIATEAAAEGLNLQFCSLVVNYDLPWNPQRIEQRIGRCHRYGQKSDVVVVNFVNQRNFADMRVFNLLSEKFRLFDDVFGASDEILGQTDGVDFEKRIWSIYQECRTEKEISQAFTVLQKDMQGEIDNRLNLAKKQVLENFDIDVQEKLKLAKDHTNAFLNRYQHVFWELTKYVLKDNAKFDESSHTFSLLKPVAGCPAVKYALLSNKNSNGVPYRLSHPLAAYVLKQGLNLKLNDGFITFTPNKSTINVTLPEYLKKAHGYLQLSMLNISAFEEERYCIISACTSRGKELTQEDCEKLLLCSGIFTDSKDLLVKEVIKEMQRQSKQHVKGKLQQIDSRNLVYFKEEENRIYRWEDDMIGSLEHELDVVKRQIREQERLARSALTVQEKLTATKKVDDLERLKRRKRNELANQEDEISTKRKELIEALDKRMIKSTKTDDIFVVGWQVQ